MTEIKKGSRCTCSKRISYDHQCEHELCIELAFKVDAYDEFWYNRWFWNERNPSFTQEMIQPLNRRIQQNCGRNSGVNALTDTSLEIETIGVDGCLSNDLDDDEIEVSPGRVAYNDMCFVFSEIARAVQHDQSQCRQVLATSKLWLSKIREGKTYDIHVIDDAVGNNGTTST